MNYEKREKVKETVQFLVVMSMFLVVNCIMGWKCYKELQPHKITPKKIHRVTLNESLNSGRVKILFVDRFLTDSCEVKKVENGKVYLSIWNEKTHSFEEKIVPIEYIDYIEK